MPLAVLVASGAASARSNGPAADTPLAIARRHVATHARELGLQPADVADVIVTSEDTSTDTGVSHVHLRQRSAGIEVFGAEMNVNVARDGAIVSLHHSFVPGLAAAVRGRSPGQDAAQAARAAARALGLEVTKPVERVSARSGPARETTLTDGGISVRPIPARLVYHPMADKTARLAWRLEIEEPGGQHLWDVVVDAQTGEVLSRIDHVAEGSGPIATSAGPASGGVS